MSDHADAKWHWGEGTKYATEFIKTLFIINGAAAVSVLTFIGNTKIRDTKLIVAMTCFAIGVVTGACAQAFAYITQLDYGNSAQLLDASAPEYVRYRRRAKFWHYATYVSAVSGLVLFIVGVAYAAFGLASADPH